MDHRQSLIDRTPLHFRAVDNADTILREDAFAFRETQYGFDLFLASLFPPPQLIQKMDLKRMLLFLANEKMGGVWRRYVYSLSRGMFDGRGFNKDKGRWAVVARYAVSEELGVQKLDLSLGRVKLRDVLTIEEYVRSGYAHLDSERIRLTLDDLRLSDEIEQKEIDTYSRRGIYRDIRKGTYTLFNEACRLAAHQYDIPFVGVARRGSKIVFEFCPSDAIFCRPLRDPAGFINLANLSTFLQDSQSIFTFNRLLKELPDSLLPRNDFDICRLLRNAKSA